MSTLDQEYKELILLSKQYLLQTYQIEEPEQKNPEWIVSEIETYNYFKTYALRNKSQANQKIIEKKVETQPKPNNLNSPAPTPKPNLEFKQQVQNEHKPDTQHTLVKPAIVADAPLEAPKKEVEKNRQFELEPTKATVPHDLTDIRKIIHDICPRQIILDEISLAYPQIIIISDNAENRIQTFLNNFSKAIDLELGPSKILSSKKYLEMPNFPDLKMIIQTVNLPNLKRDGIRHLEVFDLHKFLNNPELKSGLWESTKNTLTNG